MNRYNWTLWVIGFIIYVLSLFLAAINGLEHFLHAFFASVGMATLTIGIFTRE